MKLNITAELNGHEIIGILMNKLKENNIVPDINNIKILVLNKNGQEVEVGADKIVVKYSEEKV